VLSRAKSSCSRENSNQKNKTPTEPKLWYYIVIPSLIFIIHTRKLVYFHSAHKTPPPRLMASRVLFQIKFFFSSVSLVLLYDFKIFNNTVMSQWEAANFWKYYWRHMFLALVGLILRVNRSFIYRLFQTNEKKTLPFELFWIRRDNRETKLWAAHYCQTLCPHTFTHIHLHLKQYSSVSTQIPQLSTI